MRVVVCDDEIVFLKWIEAKIRECGKVQKETIHLESYTDPMALLERYQQSENEIDLVLLDIQMETENGIKTAQKLRSAGYDGMLVFITSSREYAIEGYQVQAYRYLVKPVDLKELKEVLQCACQEKEKRERYLVVKVDQQMRRISVRAILYLEVYGHELMIHTAKEVIKTRASMRQVQEQLDHSFVKIHKSYVVNLEQVIRYTKTSVECSDHKTLPLSRNFAADFRTELTAYWGEQLNG